MKKNIIALLFALVFSVSAKAKDSSLVRIQFKPIGFNKIFLEGELQSNSLKYENPCSQFAKPSATLTKIPLQWESLLHSGISSLLFEYKNYPENNDLSGYSVFAGGNYSKINQTVLRMANRMLLGNKYLLQQIYSWVTPYYKEAFSLLSTEEQQVLYQDLQIAEKFITQSAYKLSNDKYKNWLIAQHLSENYKITGFLKRRIMKKQWTFQDCQYWISRIKADFTPLLKDPNLASSHYQICDKVTENLFIVCNHKGEFSITNAQFQLLDSTHYRLILKNDDVLQAYRTRDEKDCRIYQLKFYEDFGHLEKYPSPLWNQYFPINDSLWKFKTTEFSGIYNHKNKKIIEDSCTSLIMFEEAGVYIADKLYASAPDSFYNQFGEKQFGPIMHHTGRLLYDLNGQNISKQQIAEGSRVNTYDMDGNTIVMEKLDFFEMTKDHRYFILKTETTRDEKNEFGDRWGVIDRKGKIIVPFIYHSISFSDDLNYFIAKDDTEKTTVYPVEKNQ